MSKADFGAMVKADLRRVTGDGRIARRDIRQVSLVPFVASGNEVCVHLEGLRLYVAYEPKPPRFI